MRTKIYLLFIFSIYIYSAQLISQTQPVDKNGNGYLNISTVAHLKWISENPTSWSYNFELDNNIDASDTKNWNEGAGFTPIGHSKLPFTGNFEGNNFTINNLFINQNDQKYIGFLGYIRSNSIIKNLGIINCDISGSNNVGGLAAYNEGTIENCSSSGKVNGFRSVGGLIGYNSGEILCSNSSCIVNGENSSIGGLVGTANYESSIFNCFATGMVTGTNEIIGGLIGENSGRVFNTYAMGNVVGEKSVGGLIGKNTKSVYNSFSIGKVSGNTNIGGLIGRNFKGFVQNCFWDIVTSGMDKSDGGIGKTTKELKNAKFKIESGWNFDFVWQYEGSYPYINFNYSYRPIDKNGNGFLNISNLNDLRWLSESGFDFDKNWELDKNIDANITKYWNGGSGFLPIGNESQWFKNQINGNGFVIDNLYINRPEEDYIGLFGNNINPGKISNIGLTNCNITGGIYVGGLIASNYVIIENCFSTGKVSGSTCVGALVGEHKGGMINNSYSNCNVIGNGYYIGGLVGVGYSAILHSYSLSTVVNKGSFTGGLIGFNSGYITNCFAMGNVLGDEYVGGLVGKNDQNKASIKDCYSTGRVKGKAFIGGLIGNNVNANVNSCFWDIETSGIDVSYGGIGKTTVEMKNLNTFLEAGWNFNFIWNIKNDYPFINIDFSKRPIDKNGNGFLNISSLEDLRWLSESGFDLDQNWELDNNINASDTKNWNRGYGFAPIGNFIFMPFAGNINGNNYVIDSIYINRSHEDFVALIGMIYADSLVVKNIGITNCNITGQNYVGGLVGAIGIYYNNVNITIKNSFSTGIINGTESIVGGLVGAMHSNSSIMNSYSSANVIAIGDYVGGFIGSTENNSLILNCYSHGNVEGNISVGGFAGSLSGIAQSCYATGKVSAKFEARGLFGIYSDNYHYNSFWDTETSGIENIEGIDYGKTTAEMKTKKTFTDAGWNFDAIWGIDQNQNEGYPYFIYNTIDIPIGIEPIDTNNNGYRNIYKLEHLIWLSENSQSWSWDYELDINIDASETKFWFHDTGFQPIGNNIIPFNGRFEGNFNQIENLYINMPYKSYVGLFAYTKDDSCEINNLGVINCKISGKDNTGGLIGVNNATISNCYVIGNIYGNDNIGGLLGSNSYYGTINDSYSISNIYGFRNIGGLIGNNNGIVTNSYTNGIVNGDNYIGGFIGKNSGHLYNNYSRSNVNGRRDVGGFVGDISSQFSIILNCYSTGEVKGNFIYSGGFTSSKIGHISRSFWDIETSNKSYSKGGQGKSSADLKRESTFTDIGWDFETIWTLNPDINDGYPYIENRTVPDKLGIEPIDTNNNGFRNIYNLEHLRWLSNNEHSWNWNYELDNNIDAMKTIYWNNMAGWIPIGSEDVPFTGKFEGNGNIIYNLFISFRHEKFLFQTGFFGYLSGDSCYVNNLGLENIEIIASTYVGGLVGYNNSIINNCYTTGKITFNNIGGGLAGVNMGSIINSYSRVNIDTYDYCVGGLIGFSKGKVYNSYSTGKITDFGYMNEYTGGFIGAIDSAEIYNCFWDIETSGMENSSSGVGKLTSEMKTKKIFTDVDWDFINIWAIDNEINDGYPYLLMQTDINVNVEEISDSFYLILYPNPSSDILHIKTTALITHTELTDILGRTVFKQGGNVEQISTAGLAPGLYLLKLYTYGGEVLTEKVVVR